MSKVRLLFLGSPPAAAVALSALASSPHVEVLGVVTQPDKPQGRGNEISPTAAAIKAMELNLPIFKPLSLKGLKQGQGKLIAEGGDSELVRLVEFLNSNEPCDLFVVVAYGKILPKTFISLPKISCLNIHFSLLPRWRGAAPVHHALLEGDRETGVCLMRIDEGLDTGDVYITKVESIRESDDRESLTQRLSQIGAKLLVDNLPTIASGKLSATPQETSGITHAIKWTKAECEVNWSDSAIRTVGKIRAASPKPGAFTSYQGEQLKLFEASSLDENLSTNLPGTVIGISTTTEKNGILVAAGEGVVLVGAVQFPSRRRIRAIEAVRSGLLKVGDRLGEYK